MESMRRRAAVATGFVALASVALAGCTSGSGHKASPSTSTSPLPSVSATESPTVPPVIDPGTEGVDDITGSALITLSGSAPVRVATTADNPGQLSVDATGKVRVEVTMQGTNGSIFSLAGPAAVGTVSGDHVSVLLRSKGVLVDNQQGNTCTVRYSKASESGVTGQATCDAQNGPQSYTVTVAFVLR